MGNDRNWKKSNERDGRGGAERRGSRSDGGHVGGLLLSTVWIKTNGAPRLSSQAEKHHVRCAAPRRAAPLCLLSVTCHHQPEPRRNTAETLTHTPPVNMSPSAARGSGNVIIVFTARPLFKLHTCHHHGSSTYGQMEGGARNVTSHTSCPLSSLLNCPSFLLQSLLSC